MIHFPPELAPPELLCFYFGEKPAYRLTPLLYAHFHNACTSAMKRLSPEDAAKLTEDLESVYMALLDTGIDPTTIPQWSPDLPTLPICSHSFPDLSRAIPATLMTGDLPDPNQRVPDTNVPSLTEPVRDTRPSSARQLQGRKVAKRPAAEVKEQGGLFE